MTISEKRFAMPRIMKTKEKSKNELWNVKLQENLANFKHHACSTLEPGAVPPSRTYVHTSGIRGHRKRRRASGLPPPCWAQGSPRRRNAHNTAVVACPPRQHDRVAVRCVPREIIRSVTGVCYLRISPPNLFSDFVTIRVQWSVSLLELGLHIR